MTQKDKIRDLGVYSEKGASILFHVYVLLVSIGYLVDMISFWDTAKVIFVNNLITTILTLLSFILYKFRYLSLKTSLAIVLYMTLANILIGTFTDVYNPLRISFFLRDSLFVVFLITLASFLTWKYHGLIITAIYLVAFLLMTGITNDDFLKKSLFLVLIFVAGYAIVIFYFVSLLDRSIRAREKSRLRIEEQNEVIREANQVLKERQQMIETQHSKIAEQSSHLQKDQELLEQKNQELEAINASKTRLISILAHDLRNPFQSILGFAGLLDQKHASLSLEKLGYYSRLLYTSARKVNLLLENLLQWAQTGSGNIPFAPKQYDLVSLVADNLEYFQVELVEKNIRIEHDMPAKLEASVDENMIHTIIRNLLANAIKYSYPGGIVIFKGYRSREQIFLEIKDHGIGMNEQTQKQINGLARVQSAEGTKGEQGTGLGLSLCIELLKFHKGTLSIESELGKGSIFRIELPNTYQS